MSMMIGQTLEISRFNRKEVLEIVENVANRVQLGYSEMFGEAKDRDTSGCVSLENATNDTRQSQAYQDMTKWESRN